MDRLRRYGLAALTAFLALNVWIASPLFALWIGSRVQGSGPPSMAAFGTVVACLMVFSIALYQGLKRVSHAYQEVTGTPPSARTHVSWLRSMRGERPDYPGVSPSVGGVEQIVVICVIVAVAAFEIWFFFFSGSPIGGTWGR